MAGMACVVVGVIGLVLFILISMMKVFSKAGQPGWAALVPIYNSYVLTCGVAKKEIIWFILMFVPFISIIAAIVVMMEVAKKFGKGGGFVIGLILLPFVFIPLLAFGDAEYEGGGRGAEDYGDFDDRPRKRKKPRRDDDFDDFEDDDRPRRKPRRDDD